ncbi:MAG: NIPSNAP family protein [Saprospiraceae bacterium]|nr:NIPSNAP family protein [Saprospiraceae bacterium]
MNCYTSLMIMLALVASFQTAAAQDRQYYEVRIYQCSTADQLDRLEQYLEQAFIPLLHQHGTDNVGIFTSIDNDTASRKKVLILIPASDLSQLEELGDLMISTDQQAGSGKDYLMTSHEEPVYDRIQTSWHRAFEHMPILSKPSFSGPLSNRVFEYRSYEGASELLYRRKVHMFNEGGEIDLFTSLGFNAVFYAETLVGPRTPNLIYMTSFENMDSRNSHWDAFRADPRWKEMSSLDKYQHTVSKADIFLLRPTSYSDIK